jgi:hypothetical protein
MGGAVMGRHRVGVCGCDRATVQGCEVSVGGCSFVTQVMGTRTELNTGHICNAEGL